MRLLRVFVVLLAFGGVAFGQQPVGSSTSTSASSDARHLGFDRNEYPGDAALAGLRRHFSFVGYWLTNPPRTTSNNWRGKREILAKNGFGFLVLADGREDAQITKAQRATRATPLAQGQADGAAAVAAAQREHF